MSLAHHAVDDIVDSVLVLGAAGWEPIGVDAFFSLPLSERIAHVIGRTVRFLKAGAEVDAREALNALRQRRLQRA